MDEQTRRAVFSNLVLLARADGEVDADERGFLNGFMQRAGIGADQARAWLQALARGDQHLQPLQDAAAADEALRLMVGVVAANGRLDDAQRRALLAWGHMMGLRPAELRDRVKALWGAAVEPQRAVPVVAPPVASDDVTGARCAVVEDDFELLGEFLASADSQSFRRLRLAALPGWLTDIDLLVFHVAEQRERSEQVRAQLMAAAPAARLVAVAGRHQAFQISYLLEAGVFRCMVEPIYTGEFNRILRALAAA